jgi:hypothetical protein
LIDVSTKASEPVIKKYMIVAIGMNHRRKTPYKKTIHFFSFNVLSCPCLP